MLPKFLSKATGLLVGLVQRHRPLCLYVVKICYPEIFRTLVLSDVIGTMCARATVVKKTCNVEQRLHGLGSGYGHICKALGNGTCRLYIRTESISLLLRWLSPGVYRTLKFYRFIARLSFGYFQTMIWGVCGVKCAKTRKVSRLCHQTCDVNS